MTVSVIIPTFNAADVLSQTVPSVLALGGAHEIIWVNDGSTDSTGRQLEDRIQGYTRAKVVHRTENQGRAAARNVGLELATGDVIAFLDADARPRPGYLEAHVQALGAMDAIASMGRIHPADPIPGDPYGAYLEAYSRGPSEPSGTTAWKHLVTCAVCVRTDVLRSVRGFLEAIRYGEDAELACRLAKRNPTGLHVAHDAVVDLYGTADLENARSKAHEFGQALTQIRALHPYALTLLDLERLDAPVTGALLKSRQLAWSIEAGLGLLTGRVQALGVRYLLGHALYQGYTHA